MSNNENDELQIINLKDEIEKKKNENKTVYKI